MAEKKRLSGQITTKKIVDAPKIQANCPECWQPFASEKIKLIFEIPSCDLHVPFKMCLPCVLASLYKKAPIHINCDQCQDLVKTIDLVRTLKIIYSPVALGKQLLRATLSPLSQRQRFMCKNCLELFDNVHHQPKVIKGCPIHSGLIVCRDCLLYSLFLSLSIFACKNCVMSMREIRQLLPPEVL